MKREPVLTVATAGAAVAAVLTLLVSFGVPLSEDQQQAILGVVAVIVPIVTGIIARNLVTPVKKPDDASS